MAATVIATALAGFGLAFAGAMMRGLLSRESMADPCLPGPSAGGTHGASPAAAVLDSASRRTPPFMGCIGKDRTVVTEDAPSVLAATAGITGGRA